MANVIAIDLGAESGRVARVTFDGTALHLEEIHRFPNIPVRVGKTLHWDALRLWHEIQSGIEAASKSGDKPAGIGLDCWGVDWAMLDRDGNLIGNPVHYRDSRTDGMMEWVFERVPRRTIFERTGIQFMQINTLFQIASLVKAGSAQLEYAQTFLSIADLFNYWMTGTKVCEFSHATTQHLYNPRTGDWDWETMRAVGIPTHLFGQIVQPGTRLGEFNGVPVFAPATHDTGSAVVAVPTVTEDYAYLSSGTWSLIGLELPEPIITDAAYEANVTNEGGYGGTFRFLKNVAGLWIAQQSRATWRAQGTEYSYADLTQLAVDAEPFRSLIDPDDPVFLPPGDMPSRIRDFCARTGQPIPETTGQVMRAIYESLALKYRHSLDTLSALSGRSIERLHIIGGGTQNTLLCQMTADAIKRPVVAGPIEATALGNAIAQLIAIGELGGLSEARELLSRTVETALYEPKHPAAWDEAYEVYQGIIGK
jgi:rhamnulokinase